MCCVCSCAQLIIIQQFVLQLPIIQLNTNSYTIDWHNFVYIETRTKNLLNRDSSVRRSLFFALTSFFFSIEALFLLLLPKYMWPSFRILKSMTKYVVVFSSIYSCYSSSLPIFNIFLSLVIVSITISILNLNFRVSSCNSAVDLQTLFEFSNQRFFTGFV